jgi:hypothetical protein
MDRREFVRLSIVGVVSGGLAACRRGANFSCAEAPGLEPQAAIVRSTLGYVDRATDAARSCLSCNHFTSAGDAACGTCRLVRGPIHPSGSCRVWVARS